MPRRNSGARLRFFDKRGVFYIVWTERGRSRERSTGTADRVRAEEALADFLHARTRKAGPRDPAEVLVTDVLADYAEEHAPDTASPWRIAAAIAPLVKFFEGNTVRQITRETCKAYCRTRARSNGTMRRELGVLRAAINYAHKEGRLTGSVTVHLPDSADAKDRWLTRGEAARLLKAALSEPRVRLHLPLFILIGLYTGHRKTAILQLRWPQVDLAAGLINFNSPGAMRTNKKRAHIPIPRKLLGHLRRARRRGTDLGYVVHENGHRLLDVKRGFASAVARAGLVDVSPHTLRHTCATRLMQKGVPLWEAAGFLGMTQDTLERVYGHHHPEHMQGAARALS